MQQGMPVPSGVKRLTADSARCLVAGLESGVRCAAVNVACVFIDDGACDEMARSIERDTGLAMLSLRNCIVSDEGVKSLCDAFTSAWDAGLKVQLAVAGVASYRDGVRRLNHALSDPRNRLGIVGPVNTVRTFACQHVRRASFRGHHAGECFGPRDECDKARALETMFEQDRALRLVTWPRTATRN